MKKLLFACMVLAGMFVLAGCSPKPPSDEEAKEYIRKFMTSKVRGFLKEKNDKFLPTQDRYDKVEVVSISGGGPESSYYDSPARLYTVTIKYHKYSPVTADKYIDWGETTTELSLAVIKDKKTGDLSLTESYTGEGSKRW